MESHFFSQLKTNHDSYFWKGSTKSYWDTTEDAKGTIFVVNDGPGEACYKNQHLECESILYIDSLTPSHLQGGSNETHNLQQLLELFTCWSDKDTGYWNLFWKEVPQ